MDEYALEIRTIPGIADGEYLDRLAELVYGLPTLIDPLLALNDDGSLTASFCVLAESLMRAAERALGVFVDAVVRAEPLRRPTQEEVASGATTVASFADAEAAERVIGSVAVASAADRELLRA